MPKRKQNTIPFVLAVNACQLLGHFPLGCVIVGRRKVFISIDVQCTMCHTLFSVLFKPCCINGEFFSTLLNLHSGCTFPFQKDDLKDWQECKMQDTLP